jgi:hypothetical protein
MSLMRVMLVAVLLVPGLLAAEPAADPSGHWEGTIQAPNRAVAFEIDLARNARGELHGTFGNPAEGEKGVPLATVGVAGREVRFAVNATAGGGTFRATLDGDGRTMAGEFTLAQGGSAPFQLQRTGEARIAPPPRSPPISKRLAGRWSGTLAAEGKQLAIGLVLANQPDGAATGTITTQGLELPVAITETGAHVRIDVPSVSGSFTGELDAGAQLVGTWSQRSLSLPLTFRRSAR